MHPLVQELSNAQMKAPDNIPVFNVGDTVRVHFRIVEGEKERVQVFEGIVISRKSGVGPNAKFTVRRIAFNEGVERVFPLHSPRGEGGSEAGRQRPSRQALLPARPRGQGSQGQAQDSQRRRDRGRQARHDQGQARQGRSRRSCRQRRTCPRTGSHRRGLSLYASTI